MGELDRARSALFSLDAGCTRDEWARIAFAAHAAGLELEDFVSWSEGAENFKSARDCAALWRGIRSDGRVTAATLFKLALEAGWRDDGTTLPVPLPRKPEIRAVEPPRHERLSDYGRALWEACRPVSGTGRAYLEARCCVIPPADGDLRWHQALKHPSGYVGPVLVGLVTDAATGEPISLHRTWIKPDGSKAGVEPARMLLGGHRKTWGVIRLWPDEAVTQGLAIAEGIETALALAHAFTPAWSVIDAGNMAALPVLQIDSLLIAADHDPAGIKAAQACAQRWAGAGREVSIATPPGERQDVNDLARAA